MSQKPQAEFPQLDSGLAVSSFLPGDDLITSLNKAMAFISTAIASRFPTTNNQLRTSSNLRNQATNQDGRVTVQQVHGRHDEDQLAFLADPRVAESQYTQTIIIHNAAFQTDDLYAFDLDCDEAPCAKAVLMANLLSYDSNVISKVPISVTTPDNFVLDNYVQEMYYFEQPTFNPNSDIEITSDSNIISYDQYLKDTKSAVVQNTALTEQ
ncbi:hypothetical protein Tco_1159467 [Tanacetum coccineum]